MDKTKIKNLFLKNWLVKLVSLIISIMLWFYVNYQKLPEKYFSIPIKILNLPKDYTIEDPFSNVATVRIKGPEEVIQSYNQGHFNAYIDLKNTGRGQYTIPVQIESIRKNKNLRIISVTPSEITIALDKFILKEIPVSPTIINSPAEGYIKTDETFFPEVITIGGPARRVNELNAVRTKPIDIGGVTGTIYKEVELDLPNESMTAYDCKSVQVTIRIKEDFKTETYNKVKIYIKNLADGLKVKNKDHLTGSIIIRGPAEKLEIINKEEQLLFIDMENVGNPGIYKRSISYNVPWNCRVIKLNPEKIDLKVEKK
ncbi:MAG: CdaR family protein [bacterium]|nr:CdaR family protein [bacterium]